jgi:hypothetical protein
MTATALSGILAFGPEAVKDTMAHEGSNAFVVGYVFPTTALTGGSVLGVTAGKKPLDYPSQLQITVSGGTVTGTFTVHGRLFGEADATSVSVVYAAETGAKPVGTSAWDRVDSIDVPTGSGRNFSLDAKHLPAVFRHRAADIDLSAIDDVRMGPNEIGGDPVPSFPYKAGQMVGGGATLYPRLQNSFAWLLWAALGYNDSGLHDLGWNEGVPNVESATAIHAAVVLTAGTQNVTTLIQAISPDPAVLGVLYTPAGASLFSGTVTLTGTGEDDAPLVEVVAFSSGSSPNDSRMLETASKFKTLTQIDLPARANTGDTISVGYPMYEHHFMFNPTSGMQSCLPWMTFYKYIPSGSCDPDASDALWELYEDCKVMGLVMTLPNNGPLTARIDAMGRKWHFSDSQPMSFLGGYEDYQSVPIGCHTGGGITIPNYSETELAVVSAQFGLVNAPLDPQQEKVVGSPDLEDITVISRSFTADLVLKWRDPVLYRRIYTGLNAGTEWTEKPFVEDLHVEMVSNSNAEDVNVPYELLVDVPSMLFNAAGGVRLAGNQAVMMRLTGTALLPASSSDHYVEFTLINRVPRMYWPTA